MAIYPAEISTFPDFLQKVWFNIYLANTDSVHLLWTRHGSKHLATEFSWWFYKVRSIPILLIIRMSYELSDRARVWTSSVFRLKALDWHTWQCAANSSRRIWDSLLPWHGCWLCFLQFLSGKEYWWKQKVELLWLSGNKIKGMMETVTVTKPWLLSPFCKPCVCVLGAITLYLAKP